MKFNTSRIVSAAKTNRPQDLASDNNRVMKATSGKVSRTSMKMNKPTIKFGLTK